MSRNKFVIATVALVIAAMILTFAAPAFSLTAATNTRTNSQAVFFEHGQEFATQSLNWAGYVAYSNPTNPSATVTSVSGSWVVQTVQSSHKGVYSAQWIGIGGYFSGDSSLIQTGTSSDAGSGSTSYSAWYELLPAAETPLSMTIAAGNIMEAHIFLVSGSAGSAQVWNIYLNDTSLGEHFFKQVSYASSMLSAEWIEERPAISGSLTTLANFGTANYGLNYTSIAGTNFATINGVSASISDFSYTSITMVKRNGQVLASVGPLNDNGTSFQAYYGGSSSTTSSGTVTHGGPNKK